MNQTQIVQAIVGLLALLLIFIGCNDFGQVAEKAREVADDVIKQGQQAGVFTDRRQASPGHNGLPGQQSTAVAQVVPRSNTEIAIGSFNIRQFGVTKIGKPQVMKTLVQIARQFDVLAIQELQSKRDQTVVPQFVEMINANGSQYEFVISPVLGHSDQTEQYVFVYDTSRVELVDQGFVMPDPQDLLSREPMVSLFRTRTSSPQQAFTFALANVHISPSRTEIEMPTLYQMYVWMRAYLQHEDDVILLGDFNVPPRKYGQLWQIPQLHAALADGIPTNTKQTHEYDNVLYDFQFTQEFRRAGVLDVQKVFGLTQRQAEAISDHLPVWATFSAGEAPATPLTTQRGPAFQGR